MSQIIKPEIAQHGDFSKTLIYVALKSDDVNSLVALNYTVKRGYIDSITRWHCFFHGNFRAKSFVGGFTVFRSSPWPNRWFSVSWTVQHFIYTVESLSIITSSKIALVLVSLSILFGAVSFIILRPVGFIAFAPTVSGKTDAQIFSNGRTLKELGLKGATHYSVSFSWTLKASGLIVQRWIHNRSITTVLVLYSITISTTSVNITFATVPFIHWYAYLIL